MTIMRRFLAQSLVPFLLFSLLLNVQILAQESSPPSQTLSFQPVIWLNNLVPWELVGLSVQYERGTLKSQSAVVRAFWSRDPILGRGSGSVAGGGSVEYRFYMSNRSVGWHVGPFIEVLGYKWLGYNVQSFEDDVEGLFDVGVQAGHKWVSGHISFDLSARTAFYSSAFQTLEQHPATKLFPQKGSEDFNSHFLISLGYAF
jgi:hypothetical protein